MPKRYSLAGDIGEWLKRAGADLPRLVSEIQQRKDRQSQRDLQQENWEKLFGLKEQATGAATSRDRATQDYRDRMLGLREQGNVDAQSRWEWEQEHPGPGRAPTKIEELLGLPPEEFELLSSRDPSGYGKTQKPAATRLQTHNLLNELIGGRRKKILSDAQAHTYGLEDADLPHPDYDIKSRAGLASASRWGLSQEKEDPDEAWYQFGKTVPDPDSTYHRRLQTFDQYDDPTRQAGLRDSITAGQIFPEIFGEQQTPAPPADWPGTEAEWLDYLQKKATQGR